MRFRVDRDQFADAVAWAGRTVPARPSMPMLSGLHLQVSDGPEATLSIASFDFTVSGRVELPADVEEPGVSLVNGRLLVDIAKALPAQPVDVSVDGTRMRVRCGRASFELPTLPAEEYPTLPQMPDGNGVLPGTVLASAVAQVVVAAGRELSLESLMGVHIEVEGTAVTLAATDRYRLAVRTLNWSPENPDFRASVLVPARTLAETAKSLVHADQVLLAFPDSAGKEGLLGIEGLRRRTTTRLLSGTFPDFRKLLPAHSPTVARVETATLMEAVKRVSLVADRSAPLRMVFTGSELALEAGTGDDARGHDAIECAVHGEPIDRVAFNPEYLLEGLSALSQPVANLAFTEVGKPAVITGAADFDADPVEDFRYVLMPFRLPG